MPNYKHTYPILTPEVQKRFVLFIEKHVGSTQEDIAKTFGVTQASVSYVMSGKRKPSSKMITTLILKYNLNMQWLSSGKGTMKLAEPENKKGLLTDITKMREYVGLLEQRIQFLEANQNVLFDRIELLDKRLYEAKN